MSTTTLHDRLPGIEGRLRVRVIDVATGALLRSEDVPNLVVTLGREMMAEAARSLATHVAVGTNGAAPLPGDTAPLENEFRKALASTGHPTATSTRYVFEIAAGDANSLGTIREFGLVLVDGEDEYLLARRAFEAGFEKTDQVRLQCTWDITF